MKITLIALLALLALFGAGCAHTTQWMNDEVTERDPGLLRVGKTTWNFTFAETNRVELGIRSDGVVVWRKSQ